MSKALETAVLALKLESEYRFNPSAESALRASHMIARDAVTLIRLSASLHGLHEQACNRQLQRREVEHMASLECAVTDTLKPYGLAWKGNSDPRGNAVGILFPNGSYNTMGGPEEGWRI